MEVSATTRGESAGLIALPGDEQQRQRRLAVNYLLLFIALALFLPSEPYLFDFLLSKGLTKTEINDEVYSIFIYARLPALLLVGLAAEVIGNAPMVFVGALFSLLTVLLTLCSSSLHWIQFTQVTVAAGSAVHAAAMFALLFDLSTGGTRQRNVHWAKAAVKLSSFAASLVGNTMMNSLHSSYASIWKVSVAAQIAAVLVSLVLVRLTCGGGLGTLQAQKCFGITGRQLWRDTIRSLRLRPVLEWILFSVLAHTAHLMVATYWQSLMSEVTGKKHNNLNGLLSGASYCLAAGILLASSHAKFLSMSENRRSIIAWTLLFEGLSMLGMGLAARAWQLSVSYILFQLLFELGSAAFLQQVAMEVDVGLREHGNGSIDPLEDGARSSSPALEAERRHPRMALLLSIANFFEACAESLVQYGFKHARTADAAPVPMRARFVMLGLGLSCLAVVAVALMVVSKLRRR